MPVNTMEPVERFGRTRAKVTLPITGMAYAASATTVEKVLRLLLGVERASVNFAARKATIEFDSNLVGPADFLRAIQDAGYSVG